MVLELLPRGMKDYQNGIIHPKTQKRQIRGTGTRKDGGKPYLNMLSVNTRTAQKCIHELKTCVKASSTSFTISKFLNT